MTDDVRRVVHKWMADREKPGYISQEMMENIAWQQRLEAEQEQNR